MRPAFPALAALALAAGLAAAPVHAQETDCDRLAGYTHTPRLPGLAGVETITDLAAAIASCQAAVEGGTDPFFGFLLARALLDYDPQDPRIQQLIALGAQASAPFAASRLGLLYDGGLAGLPQDSDRARALAEESCAALPDPRALAGCNNLGAMLVEPEEQARAYELFTLACDGGVMLGCTNLAERLTEEDATFEGQMRIADLWERACGNGDANACGHAGYTVQMADTRPGGAERAASLYARGCDQADAYSCYALGLLLTQGEPPVRDWERGLGLLDQACANDNDDACHEAALGRMYGPEMDGANVSPEDQAAALAVFESLCAQNQGASCADLGYALAEGIGAPVDVPRAISSSARGCALGNPIGCNNLAVHYGTGSGVVQDSVMAARFYLQACDGGSALGCANLAEMYAGDALGPPDTATADLFRGRACDLGDDAACEPIKR